MSDTLKVGSGEVAPASSPEQGSEQYLIFQVDEELFAVAIAEIDQVLRVPPVTSVPNAPKAVVGIFHLRGKVIVAIDIEERLGLPRERPLTPNYLFVAHHGGNSYAILIDRPVNVVRIPHSLVREPDPLVLARIPREFLSGIFMYTSVAPTRKKESSFMIEPKEANTQEEAGDTGPKERPVLVLSLSAVLDQNDLARMELSGVA